jgi:hypothetical protein
LRYGTGNGCSPRATASASSRSTTPWSTTFFISRPLPIRPEIATDADALAEYLTFQYTVGDRNLFRHVHILLPGHALTVENGRLRIFRRAGSPQPARADH